MIEGIEIYKMYTRVYIYYIELLHTKNIQRTWKIVNAAKKKEESVRFSRECTCVVLVNHRYIKIK